MKRWIIPVGASIVAVAVLALLIYGITHQGASRTLDEALAKHERPLAPDATMALPALVGGGKGTLASYRGKVVLLNFWASWCEPCQAEAPALEQTERQLARHGGTVLGVTYRDASPDSVSFIQKYHLTYPNLRDVSGEFAHSFGTDELPESFVINREGQIERISRGEVSESFLKFAVKVAEST